jgi:5-methylcytosine-specific restriction endonuclease McrA
MKEKIMQLREEGKSYNEIKKVLGCSKGTIAYHCGDGQKDKAMERMRKNRKTLNSILKRKKDNFCSAGERRGERSRKRVSAPFSSKEFFNKLNDSPKCYLTGRSVDLFQPKSYQCDHITPISKGGGCKLENLGLTCRDANQAKSDMTLKEFLSLCKEVLVHYGYSVTD